MKSNKNVNINKLKELLSEDSYKNLLQLMELVQDTNLEADNNVFDKMVTLLLKYSSKKIDYYLEDIIIHEMFSKYIDVSNKIISKMTFNNDQKLLNIYNYFCLFTEDNLNYKISVINEFKKLEIIEERFICNYHFENPFKKLLQVLSCVYRKDTNLDAKTIYEKSNSCVLHQKAKKIVNIILKLNKETELLNQKFLVKPTNGILEACCLLPDIIADDEEKFKEIVNYLYKIFWENKEFKKYAENGEIDFVNDIRIFFYHDLDHGKETDYRKKVNKVGSFYELACGKRVPKSSKDWQKIQECMYDRLTAFLEKIEISDKEKVAI